MSFQVGLIVKKSIWKPGCNDGVVTMEKYSEPLKVSLFSLFPNKSLAVKKQDHQTSEIVK